MATASDTAESELIYQALKKHECELIESLTSVDLVSLAKMAADNSLLLEKTNGVIKSIHPEVPHPVKCRYLLYNIYKHISLMCVDTEAEHLLEVLSQYRPVARVVSLVRQTLGDLEKSSALQHAATMLTENNVPVLTESLASHSSKWKEIGTSLRLPDNEIKNIMSMMHMYTPVMCLKEVLTAWTSCKYSQAKPPTLENLKKALSSRLVGLGKLAKTLNIETVVEARAWFNEQHSVISQSMNPSVTDCGGERVFALLEVQFKHHALHDPSCVVKKWC